MTKSISPQTFYDYITDNTSSNIDLFKVIYSDKIYTLPDKVVSSKNLIKHLQINNNYEFKIFQNVFLDYFRNKLIN
jgi:hypothetical protein